MSNLTELIAGIHDFTTLFSLILRYKSSEWLESSMQSDLGMAGALQYEGLNFAFFKHCF